MKRGGRSIGRRYQGGFLQLVAAGVGYLASRQMRKSGEAGLAGQAALANQQAEIGADMHDWWKAVYKPQESALAQEVEVAGSLPEQERAAGRSDATVVQQGGIASRDLERTFTDRGFGINDPRLLDAQSKLTRSVAAGRAGSQNDAREVERMTGFNKRMDFASMGRNLPAQSASILGSASNQMGGIARTQLGMARSDAYDAGYAVKPIVDGIAGGINYMKNNVGNNDGGVTFDPNRHYISSGTATGGIVNGRT